jgi:hypothetical protein
MTRLIAVGQSALSVRNGPFLEVTPFQALGLMAARLHVLVFTRREANKREVKQYEAQA